MPTFLNQKRQLPHLLKSSVATASGPHRLHPNLLTPSWLLLPSLSGKPYSSAAQALKQTVESEPDQNAAQPKAKKQSVPAVETLFNSPELSTLLKPVTLHRRRGRRQPHRQQPSTARSSHANMNADHYEDDRLDTNSVTLLLQPAFVKMPFDGAPTKPASSTNASPPIQLNKIMKSTKQSVDTSKDSKAVQIAAPQPKLSFADMEWFHDLFDSPFNTTYSMNPNNSNSTKPKQLSPSYVSLQTSLSQSSSTHESGSTSTMPPVPLTLMLQCIKDTSDPLRHMHPDTVWSMFTYLRGTNTSQHASVMLRSLTIDDWHRVLDCVAGGRTAVAPSSTFSSPVLYKQYHQSQSTQITGSTSTEPLEDASDGYNNLNRAASIVQEMKRHGVAPDAFVYTCLLRACRGRLAAVRLIFKQMTTEVSRMQYKLDSSRESVASKMMQSRSVHDGLLNGLMLRSMDTKNSRGTSATNMHQQTLTEKKMISRSNAYQARSLTPISNKSIRMMLAILLRTLPPSSHDATMPLIYSLWDASVDAKTGMLAGSSSRVMMSVDTYMGFLEGFAVAQDKLRVEMVHRLIVSRLNGLEKQHQRQVTDQPAKSRSGSVWSLRILESLMRAHLHVGNLRAVRRLLLETMVEKKIQPRLATFRLAFEALEQLKDVGGIGKAAKMMDECKLDHDAVTYSVLARRLTSLYRYVTGPEKAASSESQDGESLEEQVDRLKQSVQRLYERVDKHICASWPMKQVDVAMKVVRKMQKEENGCDQTMPAVDPLVAQPLATTALVSVIEAMVVVGASDADVDRAMKRLENVHWIEAAWYNRCAGFDDKIWGAASPTLALLEATQPWRALAWKLPDMNDCAQKDKKKFDKEDDDVHKDSVLSDFLRTRMMLRAFRPPDVPQAALAAVAGRVASRQNEEEVVGFFERRVATHERLGMYWGRHMVSLGIRLRKEALQIRQSIRRAQSKADSNKHVWIGGGRKRVRRISAYRRADTKRILRAFKARLARLSAARKRGVVWVGGRVCAAVEERISVGWEKPAVDENEDAQSSLLWERVSERMRSTEKKSTNEIMRNSIHIKK